jgi:Protein of unknown function (DUF3306)
MSGTDEDKVDEAFLSRWSRRKVEARTEVSPGTAEENPSTGAASGQKMPETPRQSTSLPEAPLELPPVESLTKDSDFTPFMQRAVPPETRNAAMKKLFSDPHFNIMDGLDTYIDDYTISTPIPPEMMRTLKHARSLFIEEDKAEAAKAETDKAEAARALEGKAEPAVPPDAASPAEGLPAENVDDTLTLPAKGTQESGAPIGKNADLAPLPSKQ